MIGQYGRNVPGLVEVGSQQEQPIVCKLLNNFIWYALIHVIPLVMDIAVVVPRWSTGLAANRYVTLRQLR